MADGSPQNRSGNRNESRPQLADLRSVDVDTMAAAGVSYDLARTIESVLAANPNISGLDTLAEQLNFSDDNERENLLGALAGRFKVTAVEAQTPRPVATGTSANPRPAQAEAAPAQREVEKKGWFGGLKGALSTVLRPVAVVGGPLSPRSKGKRGYAFGALLGAASYAGTLAMPFGTPVKIGTEVGAYLLSAGIDYYYKKRIQGAGTERKKIEYEVKRRHGFAPLVRDVCAGYAAASVVRAAPDATVQLLAGVGTALQHAPTEGAEWFANASKWAAEHLPGIRHGIGSEAVHAVPHAGNAALSEVAKAVPTHNAFEQISSISKAAKAMHDMTPQEGLAFLRETVGANKDILLSVKDPAITKELNEYIKLTGAGTGTVKLGVPFEQETKELNDVFQAINNFSIRSGQELPIDYFVFD